MSTLAQLLIEKGKTGSERKEKHRAFARAALKYLQDSLNPPKLEAGAHALDMRNFRQKAERFVFAEDPTTALFAMVDEKQVDMSTVYKTARLPAPVTWLEFTPSRGNLDGARWGVLVVDKGKKWEVICAMEGPNNQIASPYIIAAMDPLPTQAEGIMGDLAWFCDADMTEAEKQEEFKHCIIDVISSLFFLTVPRICEIKESVADAKLQKARMKKGKPPIIEMKRVTLSVGIGRTRYKNSGTRSAGGSTEGTGDFKKRLHPVIGHLRVYTKRQKEGEPLVSWVPHHYRGNAELGVVMHERDVVDRRKP